MIDTCVIQRLRELNIEQVAARLNITVNRHKAICPFHDDERPSLTFNTQKNTYRCFVCDAHGGTIDLAMNRLNKSFPDACRWLADECNIIGAELINPQKVVKKNRAAPMNKVDVRHLSQLLAQPFLNEQAQHFLFEERKLHPAVVRWLGISSISAPAPMSADVRNAWFNAPSLLIPYRDIDGNLMSVQARYLGNQHRNSEKGEDFPRFQFPRGSQCHIFNLPVLKLLHPGEKLWIAEGVSDCMALLTSGRKAIAIPSATLLKNEDLKALETCHRKLGTTFHMFPDQDAPGQRLFLDLKDRLPNLCHHQLPEGCKDFGEYWVSASQP